LITQETIQLKTTNKETISFDRALSAIREGNPFPMLSKRVRFPSEPMRLLWFKKASAVRETLDSVDTGSVSFPLAKEVRRIFIDDADTRNIELAKKCLRKLLAKCGAMSDEQYAEGLVGIAPKEEIPEAVRRSRACQDQVADYIKQLLVAADHPIAANP
jgi:hypothetical protein